MITVAEMGSLTSIINYYQQYGIEEVRLNDHTYVDGRLYSLQITFCESSRFCDTSGNKVNTLHFKYDERSMDFKLDCINVTDHKTGRERIIRKKEMGVKHFGKV